jgi:transposase
MDGEEDLAMGTAIGLRADYTGAELRKAAKGSRDASQVRRLLALAAIYDGASRGEAAAVGGVDRQTLRDWVLWFNAEGPDGLIDGKAPGNSPKLNASQRQALADIVERGPYPSVDGVVRWRLIDLQAWIREEFGISVSETTVSRELKALGFRKLTARPRAHDANELAQEHFKKVSPKRWKKSGRKSVAA